MTDITCISDLHGFFPELPGGDLLIVAGDLTKRDEPREYIEFFIWLHKQPYKQYVLIAGNHDNLIQKGLIQPGCFDKTIYLEDSGCEFNGLKIWGAPWTKTFTDMNPHCKAFTCETEEELGEKWKLIPSDVDILITHSPPLGIMDDVQDWDFGKINNVGSQCLWDLLCKEKIIPKLHIFGHIHEGYGIHRHKMDLQTTIFVNASHVNELHRPVNKPIRIEL